MQNSAGGAWGQDRMGLRGSTGQINYQNTPRVEGGEEGKQAEPPKLSQQEALTFFTTMLFVVCVCACAGTCMP